MFLITRPIDFSEILTTTNNFHESLVIGVGGFGKVYKGNITNGSTVVDVAIKRLDPMSNQGEAEFSAEVEMLSTLRHCNIVSLIGYCKHKEEKILVYEYMPNETLYDHLHRLCTPLSWLRRLNICIGAGRGLRYLHDDTGIDCGVIHADFKCSNILLHSSWAAKLSDFGLSKTCPKNQQSTYVNTRIKGSFGYLDPNYFKTGRLTRKSDVYAFGVVLLEVLCRKPILDVHMFGEGKNLITWAQDYMKERKFKQIIDQDIKDEISPKCLKKYVKIVERCLHGNLDQRPTMADIVASLETLLGLQEKFSMPSVDGRTLISRVVDMLPFPANGGNSGMYALRQKGRAEKAVHHSQPFAIWDRTTESGGVPKYIRGARVFTFDELRKHTSNFSETSEIGESRYGKVYKGSLPNSQLVAIKRAGSQGEPEFKTELELLSRVHHKNVVRLIGFCYDQSEEMIVYEYIVNGTLKDGLSGNSGITLDWMQRLKIILGAARGLQYLHDLANPPIIHRDIKTNHILLDQNLVAKVAGFGISKPLSDTNSTHVTTQVKGTMGYMDPEYYMTNQLTKKSDVYSFGVVMLELITARNPFENGKYIVMEVKQVMDKNKELYNLHEILDPIIGLSSQLKGLEKFVDLSLRCVEETGDPRPEMSEIVKEIESIMTLAGLTLDSEPFGLWDKGGGVSQLREAKSFTFEELRKHSEIGESGYGKKVASVTKGDEEFSKVLTEPFYGHIREALYSEKSLPNKILDQEEEETDIFYEVLEHNELKDQWPVSEIQEVEDTERALEDDNLWMVLRK